MDVTDRLAYQRDRNRRKQQRHRDRNSTERKALEGQIYMLQQYIRHYKPHAGTALPWNEVASVFAAASADAHSINDNLRQQCKQLRQLGNTLTTWAKAMERSQYPPEPNEPFLWRHVMLASDPTARKLSLDWYSQHLYHSTERILQYAQFPTNSIVADNLEVSSGDDLADLLLRMQYDIALPFEDAHARLHTSLVHFNRAINVGVDVTYLDEKLTCQVDPALSFYRVAMGPRVDYCVSRYYTSTDRNVYTFGNLRHDEKSSAGPSHVWRPRMFWCTLDRIGPQTTRIRLLFYNGPIELNGRRLTWREELTTFVRDASSKAIGESGDSTAFHRKIAESSRGHIQWHVNHLGFNTLPHCP
ncbi:hypothetical protein SDRG_16628 [Saprolegnia diclina VS20]|uniref:Uncharacterized protein n=1 Tax=Saprolegnia diclina (strain VS20) TaxID=1156394 RepID=T0PJG6_SAPDV|nr:hypothetical protein SDRG_16628 [Saprolegnia diclina VS20]EQC25504.1 hypothetical protein SDRG_16628 [Saprolegnia diclina VS20]|eukprot:XP_008621068.1 hypothetical protein SDRG_16628 [Saprolegnia diclina VS20]